MTKLIALTLIAAGALAADSPEVPAGQPFEANADDAEKLLTGGQARLADAVLSDASKPTPAPPAPKAVKRVKARLLVDSALGNVNDVVELEPTELKSAESSGIADGSKEGVAYALTLDQNKP